jgi:hypothetical protein
LGRRAAFRTEGFYAKETAGTRCIAIRVVSPGYHFSESSNRRQRVADDGQAGEESHARRSTDAGCRAHLITFAFVTFRALLMIPGVTTLAPPDVMIPTLLWLGWVVPILIYEIGRALRNGRAVPVLAAQA